MLTQQVSASTFEKPRDDQRMKQSGTAWWRIPSSSPERFGFYDLKKQALF